MKFGRKPKLTPQQITHARKLIDAGERREDVAALPCRSNYALSEAWRLEVLLRAERGSIPAGRFRLLPQQPYGWQRVHISEYRSAMVKVTSTTTAPTPFSPFV